MVNNNTICQLIEQRDLSYREAEVAERVARGLTNRQVADQLFVGEKTIKFHMTNIMKKLSVQNRTSLVVLVLTIEAQEAVAARTEEVASKFNGNVLPLGQAS